ncbi:DEAD/DEAH box helicase [Amnibacterium sp. CER49]|uniref:DEAD/DEAH box helicase n=1 Tax=Amnibacterium sp. CER49 TaxID=3039161 RepID=UPI002448FB4C|nr:DEAD/DEAH box helicase [Amnibacterium sp. CER49]MDH2444257.1 DEAD/DEAH box helicase [Amnibacterium sp. CER49]
MQEPEPQPADWREALDGFLRPPAPRIESAPTALALQVELRELLPRTTYRWNGPTSQAVTPRKRRDAQPGSGEYRLGVRPVTRTQRGWARGGLTWSNLPHKQRQLELDVDQHRWFTQFGALHRAGVPAAPGQDPDWLFLDDFANPVLWRLLEQAEQLGVPLVGSAGTVVRVAGPASLTFDVARDGEALRAGPLLVLGGEPVAVRRAQPIGASGLYLFDPAEPREVVLAELDVPLDAERQRLLRSLGGDGVVVPAEAVDEFLREYVPQLRDRVDVASRDGSVALPEVEPPRLVLTAAFGAGHRLALRWAWEVRRGATPPPLATVLPPGLLPESLLGDDDGLPRPAVLTELEAAEFSARVLPRLEALPGLRVTTTGTRPDYRELSGAPRLVVRAVPAEKADWFDLGIEVLLDGRRIPFTPLFKALAAGRRRILLADGAYLSLNHPAFAPLADLIADAGDLDEWRAGPRLSRYQTALWSEFEDLADEADPAVEWRALLAEVRGAPVPVRPPAGLRAELRPYQAEGLAWLSFLWRHRLGGVLADDMGLGKTLQCLALMLSVSEEVRRPFLVVAPTSVVSNWAAEASRFAPGLRVRTVTATEAKAGSPIADLAAGADVVVTSYALLRLDAEGYRGVAEGDGWAGLILDEAQFVKNAASRIHEVVRDLPVPFKLAVTGTPMENSLTELHAVLAVVAPGLFASALRFREEYVRPIEEVRAGVQQGVGAGDAPEVAARLRADRLARLRQRIRPFLLRRTKETVAAELPPKQEQVLTVDLAPDHRALYDVWLQRERRKLFNLLSDMDRNRFIVFRSLTLLRLLALDPALIGEEATGSKLDALLEQLDDVLAEGHRALVFSQFTSYLSRVQQRLTEAGIQTAYLDGSTRDRDAAIAAFKDGDAPVFLISLKAGGFGLNLTEADYVFLLDPWWNPASEDQAIDRAHRIGQDKQVMVYRLVAAGTIEEKVMQLKARKAAVFDAVIDDEALFGSLLDADDVRELLG